GDTQPRVGGKSDTSGVVGGEHPVGFLLVPDLQGQQAAENEDYGGAKGRHRRGPAQPAPRARDGDPLPPGAGGPGGAQRAQPRAGHRPRAGPVLFQQRQQLVAVAPPPPARIQADHQPGQLVGEPVHAGAIRWWPTATIRAMLVSCSARTAWPGPVSSYGLRRSSAGSGRTQPRASSRVSAPYRVPGSILTPLNAAMSFMIA